MSQFAASAGAHGGHGSHDSHPPAPLHVDPKLVTLEAGAGGFLSNALLFAGLVGLVATGVAGFAAGELGIRHAVLAYLIGFAVTLTFALGSLGYVMIFQQTNAGWSAGLRRQFENIASLVPFCLALFLPVLLATVLWHEPYQWMDPHHAEGDFLLAHKAPYLNTSFWYARVVLYFGIWTILAAKLYRWSREQDRSGDKWLTAKARRMSSVGLLLLALTSAFGAFDWLMGLDAHWFSTMFGVWFFSGSLLASASLCVLVLGFLRRAGKLGGFVTAEHFHDLGKLMLGFTVFWAYISFCQYFLIWYSNIPEETMWFRVRKQGGWENLGNLLAFGHFLAPFLVLLWRQSKRSTTGLMALAVWILMMHVADVFFVVRPALYPDRLGLDHWWIDLFGIVTPIALFLGALVRKIASAPLIPLNDPRLPEALHHHNYV